MQALHGGPVVHALSGLRPRWPRWMLTWWRDTAPGPRLFSGGEPTSLKFQPSQLQLALGLCTTIEGEQTVPFQHRSQIFPSSQDIFKLFSSTSP